MTLENTETPKAPKLFSFGEAMLFLESNPGIILRVEGETSANIGALRYEASSKTFSYAPETDPTFWQNLGGLVQYLTAKSVVFTDAPPVVLDKEWETIVTPFGQYSKAVRRMIQRLVKRMDSLEQLALSLQAQLDTLTPKKKKKVKGADSAETEAAAETESTETEETTSGTPEESPAAVQ